ncbi:NAD_dependent epimerase/dehydratase [Hexamita inflata]|uniref:NAD dependent epimerase/dehydratase n=1 Tax=Hexamita inflata TaxID=28002 RepID=A0AA86NAW4_9EUKA|nr:NAD dependent epimerase/dehydratase [Hexamita inflata]CAI9939747.1 NAD dependent epimerase/dehydratase [Hexamita inflata]
MSSYLVLGGTGFIGRTFVDFLEREELASKIRVVDKKSPEMSNMSKEHEAMFENEALIEFVQADLSRDNMLSKAFGGAKFEFVVNCAGENEFGLSDDVYEEKVVLVTEKCAKQAAQMGAKFIQISDARIYKSASKPVAEDGNVKPSTKLATAHLKAETILKGIPGLNYVILRPSTVYGPGDRNGIMNRCVLAATYVYLKDTMKVPFNAKVIWSTVHVRDLAGAIQAATKAKSGEVYNVADSGNITLGEVNTILESVFGIKVEFLSGAINLGLKAAVNVAAEVINDRHMKPWNDYCVQQKIDGPILSPFLCPEILTDADQCIDGTKITKLDGFSYRYQKPNAGVVLESVNYFRKQGQFPK